MTTMAAVAAVEEALRKGTLDTKPTEDAERIARVARRHRVSVQDLGEAAADIRDWSRRPTLPLAATVWRVLGDPGADVLELAIRLLTDENDGSTAAV
jgi:hypothetical protein